MNVVIVGPVPGMAPNSTPMPVPRSIAGKAWRNSARLGRMSRMRILIGVPTVCMRLTLRRNSATPNNPSASATSSTPSSRSVMPKVKRCAPVSTSVPATPSSRPITVIATPLSGEPRDMVAPASRPSSMMEKISGGPNLKDISTSSGEAKIITMMPTEAAKNEHSMVMPRAVPLLPWSVSG